VANEKCQYPRRAKVERQEIPRRQRRDRAERPHL